MYKRVAAEVTIALNGTLSDAANLGRSGELLGVETNSSWTAGDLTFEGSNDGTNYESIRDGSGSIITIASANLPTSNGWTFELTQPIRGYRYIKAKCANAQAATRTLRLTTFQNRAG